MQIHHIQSCFRVLERIKTVLDKNDSSSDADSNMGSRIKKKLLWPLSISETKELVAEVERHKTTLNLALTADGMLVFSPPKIIIPHESLTTLANLVTIRTALLNALANQREDMAEIQAELRRKRKETAKRNLGKLPLVVEYPCRHQICSLVRNNR